MSASPDYNPPNSRAIKSRQNETEALRLLLAQRRLYRRAKRWLGLRWFGMLVIGLAAPVISVANPSLAVWSGAVAGLWIFFGRTVLLYLQANITAKAAATQEQFDFYVFGMPDSIDRSGLPSLEEIARITGPDEQLGAAAASEGLPDWYPIDDADPGVLSVAISQRANASYADRLLRSTALFWGGASVAWAVILVIVSVIVELPLLTFLAGVLLPILPAFLDVVQYVVGIWRAARERGDLARTIEKRLRGIDAAEVEPNDLLLWQERLYELRCSTPEVPDLVYKLQRKSNERAMHAAAEHLRKLANDVRQKGSSS